MFMRNVIKKLLFSLLLTTPLAALRRRITN